MPPHGASMNFCVEDDETQTASELSVSKSKFFPDPIVHPGSSNPDSGHGRSLRTTKSSSKSHLDHFLEDAVRHSATVSDEYGGLMRVHPDPEYAYQKLAEVRAQFELATPPMSCPKRGGQVVELVDTVYRQSTLLSENLQTRPKAVPKARKTQAVQVSSQIFPSSSAAKSHPPPLPSKMPSLPVEEQQFEAPRRADFSDERLISLESPVFGGKRGDLISSNPPLHSSSRRVPNAFKVDAAVSTSAGIEYRPRGVRPASRKTSKSKSEKIIYNVYNYYGSEGADSGVTMPKYYPPPGQRDEESDTSPDGIIRRLRDIKMNVFDWKTTPAEHKCTCCDTASLDSGYDGVDGNYPFATTYRNLVGNRCPVCRQKSKSSRRLF